MSHTACPFTIEGQAAYTGQGDEPKTAEALPKSTFIALEKDEKRVNEVEILDYIVSNALILIPVLMIIGMILKNIQVIPDKWIPLILLPLGIGGAMGLMGVHMDAVVQGVLVTGAAVYGHQIAKQMSKPE